MTYWTSHAFVADELTDTCAVVGCACIEKHFIHWCQATYGEPGNGEVECDKGYGHAGEHEATVTW